MWKIIFIIFFRAVGSMDGSSTDVMDFEFADGGDVWRHPKVVEVVGDNHRLRRHKLRLFVLIAVFAAVIVGLIIGIATKNGSSTSFQPPVDITQTITNSDYPEALDLVSMFLTTLSETDPTFDSITRYISSVLGSSQSLMYSRSPQQYSEISLSVTSSDVQYFEYYLDYNLLPTSPPVNITAPLAFLSDPCNVTENIEQKIAMISWSEQYSQCSLRSVMISCFENKYVAVLISSDFSSSKEFGVDFPIIPILFITGNTMQKILSVSDNATASILIDIEPAVAMLSSITNRPDFGNISIYAPVLPGGANALSSAAAAMTLFKLLSTGSDLNSNFNFYFYHSLNFNRQLQPFPATFSVSLGVLASPNAVLVQNANSHCGRRIQSPLLVCRMSILSPT